MLEPHQEDVLAVVRAGVWSGHADLIENALIELFVDGNRAAALSYIQTRSAGAKPATRAPAATSTVTSADLEAAAVARFRAQNATGPDPLAEVIEKAPSRRALISAAGAAPSGRAATTWSRPD